MARRPTGRAFCATVALLLMLPCADCLAQSAQTATSPYRDEWKPVPKTLSELLDTDYEIVSILAPSPQTRWYFLRKPGSFVKCTEQAILREPPSLPANMPPPPGGAAPPEHPERKTGAPPKAASAIDCAELSRVAMRRTP